MVRLQPFNGLNIFGTGADGSGPNAGTLTGSAYNYTDWDFTGIITLNPTGTGTTIRVLGNFSMSGAGALIQCYPEVTGAADWGAATDGVAGGAGGDATGVTLSRITTMEEQLWTTYRQAGYGYGPTGKGYGNRRFTLLVGGTVNIDTTVADRIDFNGTGSATASSGGGGGGLICIISGTGITVTGTNFAVKAQGYKGRDGAAAAYGGGGGGGGAIILMAPTITGITLGASYVAGGVGGSSTFAGGGNAGGGGGSFGAGGAGGSVAHPAGYNGSAGQTYSLLIPPIL